MAKIKVENLKKELMELNGEIFWKEEQISRSLDYGAVAKLKNELDGLKAQQLDLLRKIEAKVKQKAFIKNRGKLRIVGFRNGNRTVML